MCSFVLTDILSRNTSQKKMTKGVFCGLETLSQFTLSTESVDAVLCFEINNIIFLGIFPGYLFPAARRTSKCSGVCAENSQIPHITENLQISEGSESHRGICE